MKKYTHFHLQRMNSAKLYTYIRSKQLSGQPQPGCGKEICSTIAKKTKEKKFTIRTEKIISIKKFLNTCIVCNCLQVVYTWEMDFNRSLLGAATLLVPKKPTPAPSSTTMPMWAHNSWVCLFAAMLAVAIGGNAIVIWIVTGKLQLRGCNR